MLVDSHCHLDVKHFDDDRTAVLRRAAAAGVGIIVNPGIDLQHSRQAIALAEAHEMVYAAVGVHPTSSQQFGPATVTQLRKMAAHPKVVAIGEIGLDYHWKKVAPAKQADAFQAQLALAAELGLPVIIHNREASADVAATLTEWVHSAAFRQSPLATRPFAGVLHAFGGDLALAEAAYSWNFVLGLGGPITFTNAHQLHELVPQLRLDRLLVETDAPYLTPHPHRGKRNEPSYVALVCDQLAHLLQRTPTEIARSTTAVAQALFGWDRDQDDAVAPNSETKHLL